MFLLCDFLHGVYAMTHVRGVGFLNSGGCFAESRTSEKSDYENRKCWKMWKRGEFKNNKFPGSGEASGSEKWDNGIEGLLIININISGLRSELWYQCDAFLIFHSNNSKTYHTILLWVLLLHILKCLCVEFSGILDTLWDFSFVVLLWIIRINFAIPTCPRSDGVLRRFWQSASQVQACVPRRTEWWVISLTHPSNFVLSLLTPEFLKSYRC